VDDNENGQWDTGEPSLAGVTMTIRDIRNGVSGESGTTGEDGKANLYIWMPGCPKVELEVSAHPPTGYRLTTENPVRVGRSAQDVEVVRFGLVPIDEPSNP
ncbi:MAG: hypothetical protein ACK2U9_19580, partial [Anaerolineae bacterium]